MMPPPPPPPPVACLSSSPGPPLSCIAGMRFLTIISGPFFTAYLAAELVASRAAGPSTSIAASRTALVNSSTTYPPPLPLPLPSPLSCSGSSAFSSSCDLGSSSSAISVLLTFQQFHLSSFTCICVPAPVPWQTPRTLARRLSATVSAAPSRPSPCPLTQQRARQTTRAEAQPHRELER